MNFSKRLVVAVAVVSLVIGALVGPAVAHTRTISKIYTADWGQGGIHVQAWLAPMEEHPGTMKITLKKKNAAGGWVLLDRKTAHYQIGWGYFHTFPQVAGNKVCKAIAKFTSSNHPNLTKASPQFGC